MKKLLLVLLFVPLASFGQSMSEALSFLKTNISDWACESVAHGTLIPRLTFSYNYDSSKLIIKMKMPEYSGDSPQGYSISEIELSEILRIDTSNSKECAAIKIITRPMGIESYGTSRNGRVNISKAKFNEFYGQFGWINEDIRILNNYTFNERNDRILKAIKYMAVQNGAKLKETYF